MPQDSGDQTTESPQVKSVRNIRYFCISLNASVRRAAFLHNAQKFGIPIEFFDAVSVDDLRNGAAVPGCSVNLSDLSWTYHERGDPRRQNAPLMFAEIACAYSHLLCWQLAVRENLDYLVVFEDDAIICQGVEHVKIPADADIFYVSNRMPRNVFGEAAGYGCGTEGYILSRSGLKKCLEIFKTLYMPIDLQLLAHQRSQFALGHGLVRYRQKLRPDLYLNAYVADRCICNHPPQSVSHISI